jgi:hypothetical protein
VTENDETRAEGTAPPGRQTPAEKATLELVLDGRPVVRPVELAGEAAAVYADWLSILNEAGIRYSLGGAYAVYAYTGIWRDSKDLDVFLEPELVKRALEAFKAAGYETEVRDRLWLAKVHRPPLLLDLLFAVRHTTSLRVGPAWFASCRQAKLLGVPTCLLAVEELIASKIYLASRDRFDGADIAHLILVREGQIDWRHVVELLGGDEEILLWHLLFFEIVYPGHADYLPVDLMERAFGRMRRDRERRRGSRNFRGMLLDPQMFAVDRDEWGYQDTRENDPLVDSEGHAA